MERDGCYTKNGSITPRAIKPCSAEPGLDPGRSCRQVEQIRDSLASRHCHPGESAKTTNQGRVIAKRMEITLRPSVCQKWGRVYGSLKNESPTTTSFE